MTLLAPSTLWDHPVLIGTPRTIAGVAGQLAVTNLLPARLACVLADDPHEHDDREGDAQGLTDVAGVPILGTTRALGELHARMAFTCAVVSFPARMRAIQQQVLAQVRNLGVPIRVVPPLDDLLTGAAQGAGVSMQGELNVMELVGRTPYGLNPRLVRPAIEGKRVLVTGAGGSIGSELCRIVATFRPSLLVLMERSENALFEIDRQIAQRFPDVARKAVLHDIVDDAATNKLFTTCKPHAIFHAAAHKHVPLMEDHPSHAVSNNVFGSKSVADAAVACGAERLVFISSDKAVNPTSMMGATKRLAEVYVQWLAQHQPAKAQRTSMAIVRFGNVLGSACSVLPIWTSQLAEGGPLTVTDPRMSRYFMTIPEAASLVIQAGAMAGGGSGPAPVVYELDMGEPIRILDLAMRFARAHGYEPRIVYRTPAQTQSAPQGSSPLAELFRAVSDVPAIEIAITGARPGEKLHEELAYSTQSLHPTPCPGILALPEETGLTRADGSPLDVPAMIADLARVRTGVDAGLVRTVVTKYVPGFAEARSGIRSVA